MDSIQSSLACQQRDETAGHLSGGRSAPFRHFPAEFDEWVKTGKCPYSDVLFQRACNFIESKEIWAKGIGRHRPPFSLMLRLFKEKGIKWEPVRK